MNNPMPHQMWEVTMLFGVPGPSRAQLILLSIKQRLRICALDRYGHEEEGGSLKAIRQSVLELLDVAWHVRAITRLSSG